MKGFAIAAVAATAQEWRTRGITAQVSRHSDDCVDANDNVMILRFLASEAVEIIQTVAHETRNWLRTSRDGCSQDVVGWAECRILMWKTRVLARRRAVSKKSVLSASANLDLRKLQLCRRDVLQRISTQEHLTHCCTFLLTCRSLLISLSTCEDPH